MKKHLSTQKLLSDGISSISSRDNAIACSNNRNQ